MMTVSHTLSVMILVYATTVTLIYPFQLHNFNYDYKYSRINRHNVVVSRLISVITDVNRCSRYYDLKLYSSDLMNDDDTMKSIYDEISDLIDFYVEKSNAIPLISIEPSILTEYAHILSKGRVFEDVMDSKLSKCNDPIEIKTLENVNAFLQGFIKSERRNRSRLKINYILAGITTNKLEDSIELLSERYFTRKLLYSFYYIMFTFSDEIDSHLMSFVDSLIQKEVIRSSGPAGLLEEGNNFDGVGQTTLSTLKMIQKRLKVEYKLKDRWDIKLLSKLLRENDQQFREEIMMQNLKKLEEVEYFNDFVTDGIQHMIEMQSKDNDDDNNDKKDDDFEVYIGEASGKSKLPAETFSKMKDVLTSLQQWKTFLQTGLTTDDIYSTSKDDYLTNTLKKTSELSGNQQENELQ